MQHSVWEHSDLEELKRISRWIKEADGRAIILKKEVVR